MKPRLLVIHRALVPYRIDLFNELYRRFDTKVYFEYPTPFEQQFSDEITKSRVRFPYRVLPQIETAPANFRPQLYSIVKKFRPHLILCSEINMISGLLYLAKAFHGQARLISMIDDNESLARQTLSKVGFKSLFLPRLDGMICCDQRAVALYERAYAHQYHYLPIVQDETYIRAQLESALPKAVEIRRNLASAEEKRIMLFVGRLAEEKNLPSLIRSFSDLIPQHPHWQLILVGDGPLRTFLQILINQSPFADHIHLVGKREGEELYSYYAAADCLVLPSNRELFAAVVVEGLIAGLPAAVSSVAGSTCLIGETNGCSFSPFSSSELSEALRRLMSKIEDSAPWQSSQIKRSLMPYQFTRYIDDVEQYLLGLI
ncbi:MAG: glycosyltransferase family 4 protein [Porphyromonas sp.]|nr:glycosyltransferase family 4 protein [Porphyromonas sp.]